MTISVLTYISPDRHSEAVFSRRAGEGITCDRHPRAHQRGPARRQPHRGDRDGADAPRVPGRPGGAVARPHRSRADAALVHAGHRRPGGLRFVPTGGQRRRRRFMPATADLEVGGSYKLEGNAGGEILECEPPKRLKVAFGGPTSLLELRLLPGSGASTELELEHSRSEAPAPGGSGALWVGPGWDGALMGLDLYVSGELPEDANPVEMASSPEVIKYNEQSVRVWIEAIRSSGTTSEDDLAEAAKIS